MRAEFVGALVFQLLVEHLAEAEHMAYRVSQVVADSPEEFAEL
jgi:hypothetical protein